MGNTPNVNPKKRSTPAPPNQATSPRREIPWTKIGTGIAILGAILLAVFIGTSADESISGVPEGTEILAAAEMGEARHIDGEIPHPEGDNPAGGPHNPTWLNCGIYDIPVPSENVVHSLEHGAVWITYQGLSEDEIDTLVDAAGRRQRIVLSPEPTQEERIRLTAWGHRIKLDDVGDERLIQFINEFESSPTNTPEPGASCSNGVGAPIG